MKEVRVIITIDEDELYQMGFYKQPDKDEVCNAIHEAISLSAQKRTIPGFTGKYLGVQYVSGIPMPKGVQTCRIQGR